MFAVLCPRWQKHMLGTKAEEAVGLLAKIISGAVTPTSITLSREDRTQTAVQGETQTNAERRML